MKLFMILAIFLVALQNISAAPHDDLEAVNVKDLVNAGLKLVVKGLNVTIDVTEKLANDYAKNPSATVEEINQKLIKFGDSVYTRVVDLIDKLLVQLEAELNASGKKGIECLRNQRKNINGIVDDGISTVVHCVGANLSSIISPALALIDSGKITRDTLAGAQIKLDKCQLGDVCLVQLLSDLKDLPSELLVNIQKAVPLVRAVIEVVVHQLPHCVATDLAAIWKNIITVIDNTMDCIVK